MIMRNVIYALLPLCVFAVWLFGISAAALIATSLIACLLTEHLICKAWNKSSSIGDGSAIITALLLALTLPPGFPLWMTFAGGMISIGVGKMLFGGIGCNLFNPALVGRAFLQASFPVAITMYSPPRAPVRFAEFIPSTFTPPFAPPQPLVDAFTSATPLMMQKFDHVSANTRALFFGDIAGSAGETSVLLIVICGLYLALRRMLDWRIPASMLASAALLAALYHAIAPAAYPTPWFVLCSGGLMLGAVFMATDMVGSPVTPLGIWIYGAMMGVVTVLIRFHGGLPEGVMYAILLGNAASPLIDNLTQPRIFGARQKEKHG